MVNRVGVLKLEATVWPSSMLLVSTIPSMGEVMVAYPRFVSALFTVCFCVLYVSSALL